MEFDADELSEKARAALNDAQRNWERLDEKPAAVALTVSILVGLWVRPPPALSPLYLGVRLGFS